MPLLVIDVWALGPALTVTPNPATDRVRVEFGPAVPGAVVQLVDARGRVMRMRTIEGGQDEIELKGLPPGLYAVRLHTGPGKIASRLQVKH